MKLKDLIHKPFNYTFQNAALIIIAINIAIYMIVSTYPQIASLLSLNIIYVAYKHAFWQFLTYSFLHTNVTHLLCNMLAIFFFGVSVERSLGTKEFLLLYFSCTIFCGIVSFLLFFLAAKNGYLIAYYLQLYGSSGVIYALLFAYAVIFPRSEVYLFFILPIRAPILVIAYAALELFSQLTSTGFNIANCAYLIGFIFAWLYFEIRMRINPWKVWFN